MYVLFLLFLWCKKILNVYNYTVPIEYTNYKHLMLLKYLEVSQQFNFLLGKLYNLLGSSYYIKMSSTLDRFV